MHITITTDDKVFNLDVDPNEPIENIKVLIETETQVPIASQVLLFENKEMATDKALMDFGVKEGDLLMLQVRQPAAPAGPTGVIRGQAPGAAVNATDLAARLAQSLQQGLQQTMGNNFRPAQPASHARPVDPEQFRNYIMSNMQALEQLSQNDPDLYEAVMSGTTQQLGQLLAARAQLRASQEQQRLQLEHQLQADPFNVDLQRKIEEQIRQEAVDSNMEQAIEYTPESFGRVTMLYIDSEVNNIPIKAFVDSGAQQTIMSASAAKRCNIFRLVDKRFQGIAKGVGTARILGRVHLTQIKIGGHFFPISITVLEDPSMDFLLGLDMLKRHQCSINLKKNALRIGSVRVPFLAEKDLPAHLRDGANDSLRASSDGVPPAATTTSTSSPSGAPPATVRSPAPTATTISSPPPPQAASQPEQVVQSIMSMGFAREAVLRALTAANGNAETAIQLLLSGSS